MLKSSWEGSRHVREPGVRHERRDAAPSCDAALRGVRASPGGTVNAGECRGGAE